MSVKKLYFQFTERSLSPFLVGVGFVAIYLSIWFGWQDSRIPTIVAAVVGLVLLAHFNSRKMIVVYLIGMLCGTGMEILSVLQGFWTYQNDTLFGVPPYLFAVWGAIGLFGVSIYKFLGGSAQEAQYFSHGTTLKRGFMVFMLPALAVLCTWLFWHDGFSALGLVSILAFAQLWHFHSRALLVVFIISIFGGIIGDIVSVPQGIWYYADAAGAQIPLVIFPAWGMVGVFFATLYDYCERFAFFRKKIIPRY